MTIAAGFLYSDGVLLCADTEVTGWAMTTHATKLDHFDCPGGKIGMAFAGNMNFAISTIQKCKRKLQNIPASGTLTELERILDREYRKTVLSHPNQATDPSLHYWILISVCSPSGELSLYATEQTTVRQIYNYACVGIGDALATSLLRPAFDGSKKEREVMTLAAFVLACVKDSVPGCGGLSHFVVIRKDRTVNEFMVGGRMSMHANLEWMNKHAKGYDDFARRILLSIPNPEVTDSDFEAKLEAFKNEMLKLRADWRDKAFVHGSMADLLQGLPKTKNIEDSVSPPPTADAPSHPPSSPESFGGSGES